MLIRLLVTAAILLAIAKHYLHDTKQSDIVRPKVQLDHAQKEIDRISQEAEEKREETLKDLGL